MTEMTVGERARTLAADLIGQLAENCRGPRRRHRDVGPLVRRARAWTLFGLVCMAAMQTTFTDWLHGVPAAEFPPGRRNARGAPEVGMSADDDMAGFTRRTLREGRRRGPQRGRGGARQPRARRGHQPTHDRTRELDPAVDVMTAPVGKGVRRGGASPTQPG